MELKRIRKDLEEIDRSSKVKLHKSGKHWVRTVVSKLGLLRLFKSGVVEKTLDSVVLEQNLDNYQLSSQLLRAIMSVGAVTGGGLFLAENTHAEELAVEKTLGTTVLTETDVVVLSPVLGAKTSQSDTVSESENFSTSVLLSLSVSESLSTSSSESMSESHSLSESLSESFSESIFESGSLLESHSISESLSESVSESILESISFSESHSESVRESLLAQSSVLAVQDVSKASVGGNVEPNPAHSSEFVTKEESTHTDNKWLGLTYRVEYRDADTGELLGREPRSLSILSDEFEMTKLVTELASAIPVGYVLDQFKRSLFPRKCVIKRTMSLHLRW